MTKLAEIKQHWEDTERSPRLVASDVDWLIEQAAENERLRAVVEAAEREEQRHIRDVYSRTREMPPEKQAWYRQAHRAGCDLAGVLALASNSRSAR